MTLTLRPDGPTCDEPDASIPVDRAVALDASSGPTPVWHGRSGLGADRTGRRAGLGVLIGSFAVALLLLVGASMAFAQTPATVSAAVAVDAAR
jgi:hypothetical protein